MMRRCFIILCLSLVQICAISRKPTEAAELQKTKLRKRVKPTPNGTFWQYGTCGSSPAWGSRSMGGQWSLFEGSLKMRNALNVKGDVNPVTFMQPFYGVLNAAYLSLFRSQKDAARCAKPIKTFPVSNVMAAHPYTLKGAGGADSPPRHCFELVHRPALKLETIIFCCPGQPDRHSWVARFRSQLTLQGHLRAMRRRIYKSAFTEEDADALQGKGLPRMEPEALFKTPAPNTVCVPEAADRPAHCLAAAPGAAMTEGGAVALWPPMWSGGLPVRPVSEQQWKVVPVVGNVVLLCQPEEAGGRCLTVEPKSEVSGMDSAAPRILTECQGADLQCFPLPEQTLASAPKASDALPCQRKCWQDNRCTGWTHTRAGEREKATGYCCLKTGPVTCQPDTCCSGGMKVDAEVTKAEVNTVEKEGIPGRIVLRSPTEALQQLQMWSVIAGSTPGLGYLHLNITAPPPDMSSRCLTDNYVVGSSPADTAERGVDVVLGACQPMPQQMWRLPKGLAEKGGDTPDELKPPELKTGGGESLEDAVESGLSDE